jgi:acetylornithine deacetylase/succinyl-diaminopimelate desuccinylase-like protein
MSSLLAQVPTDVPVGFETLMEPDDPKLVHYVQNVVRPPLAALGADLIEAPRNNLVAGVGSGSSGRSILIQNYTVTQHHNLMPEPFSGKIACAREFGFDEPAVFGQGVSQNKVHQAVMLTVLKLLRDANVRLVGRLYWAVNNEGRSSHDCSTAILRSLPEKPDFCVLQIGGLRISLGNRGRVDVHVHVRGKVTHSSSPQLGHSAIDGANEVVNRLRVLSWNDRHPILGGRHALVYKIRYEPMAPHTLPSDAYLTVDRRLLPGDQPADAVEEIARAIGDLSPFEVDVTQGSHMWPSIVHPDDAGVVALATAHRAVTGRDAETYYGQGTFDAGGPSSAGVPTVMYGAKAGVWPTGTDFVPISHVETEARVLAALVLSRLT